MSFIVMSFLLFFSWGFSQEVHYYRGQKHSLIDWERLDANDWLSFGQWKKNRHFKDSVPMWEVRQRDTSLHELVGRVVDCIGECRVYRDEGYFQAQYRTGIQEGDEFHTFGESYAWIYLMDGTLVRLSPHSSVTFREINFAPKHNFFYARLNSGNILWLSRVAQKYHVQKNRETDTLFLPLSFYEANIKKEKKPLNEENLFSFLEESSLAQRQYERLNKLLDENNKQFPFRPTHSFLVMPNGTVWGQNLTMEFVVLIGGKSYFKNRDPLQLGLEGVDNYYYDAYFLYRGFENTQSSFIESGKWYEVDEKGRSLEPREVPSLFRMGEYITQRIPSILVTRELLLKKYSSFLKAKQLEKKKLAEEMGYRLWEEVGAEGSDLTLRVSFLKEYTRRLETTHLLVSERFREKLRDRGEEAESMSYNRSFFNRALVNFMGEKERKQRYKTEDEQLNSTQKDLWKKLHGL